MVVSMDVSAVASEESKGETASAETVMEVLLRFLGMVGDVCWWCGSGLVGVPASSQLWAKQKKVMKSIDGNDAVSWRSLTKIDISLIVLSSFPLFFCVFLRNCYR